MGGTEAEHDALCEFLGLQREALIRKLDGRSEAQARATPTASSMSLLGLVRHSAVWERRWFQMVVAGCEFPDGSRESSESNDRTFVVPEGDDVASVVKDYRAAIEESNAILRAAELDAKCARPDLADGTVRWVALRMIEETARHAGHADIIRETIDGTTGR